MRNDGLTRGGVEFVGEGRHRLAGDAVADDAVEIRIIHPRQPAGIGEIGRGRTFSESAVACRAVAGIQFLAGIGLLLGG